MKYLSNPWVVFAVGVIAGYAFSRELDKIPFVRNTIPKVRL